MPSRSISMGGGGYVNLLHIGSSVTFKPKLNPFFLDKP